MPPRYDDTLHDMPRYAIYAPIFSFFISFIIIAACHFSYCRLMRFRRMLAFRRLAVTRERLLYKTFDDTVICLRCRDAAAMPAAFSLLYY